MQEILNNLPTTLQEFQSLSQAALATPEQTCIMLLCALHLYVADKDTGISALNVIRGPRPMTPYDTQFLRDRLYDKPYLPLAYFQGATPQNNYQPDIPYMLDIRSDSRPQDVESGYIRVFLKTTGADSPRPIKLRQKGNQWFLWEYSSILTGIRIPVEKDPWA